MHVHVTSMVKEKRGKYYYLNLQLEVVNCPNKITNVIVNMSCGVESMHFF